MTWKQVSLYPVILLELHCSIRSSHRMPGNRRVFSISKGLVIDIKKARAICMANRTGWWEGSSIRLGKRNHVAEFVVVFIGFESCKSC